MKEDFFKFPSTPHLTAISGVDVREDKILTKFEREEFLRHEITIEEKVDGANLGISFDVEGRVRVQSRGEYLYLPGSGQWKKLDQWLTCHTDSLFEHLADQYILFGEWCYARHSIFYDRLPDWFLAFDVCDKLSKRFLSSERRDQLLDSMHIFKVPQLSRGQFSCCQISNFLSQSKLSEELAEGVYLRLNRGDWLQSRAKLVRTEFLKNMGSHWSQFTLEPNRICKQDHQG